MQQCKNPVDARQNLCLGLAIGLLVLEQLVGNVERGQHGHLGGGQRLPALGHLRRRQGEPCAAVGRQAGAAAAEPADALPLLDGVADVPPKPRRSSRAAKGGREGASSNVE